MCQVASNVPVFGLPSVCVPANTTATRPGSLPAVTHWKTVERMPSRSTCTGAVKAAGTSCGSVETVAGFSWQLSTSFWALVVTM
jgi:hypothetical protein